MYVLAEPIRALAAKWNAESHKLRDRYGDRRTARAFQTVAEDLLERLEASEGRLYNLQEASEVSGYSPDHLGRLVRGGQIPNAGRPNAPKIALRDLPMKPGHLPSGGGLDELTEARAEQIARSVVSPKEGHDG